MSLDKLTRQLGKGGGPSSPPKPSQRGSASTGVDEYLARVPADLRAALEALRATIRDAAPEAEEVISYQIPAFRQNGTLVYYAAFRDHCSFFVGSRAIQESFAAELKPFASGKGTLRFTPRKPLPSGLVRRIVKARVAENAKRVKGKRAPVRVKSRKKR